MSASLPASHISFNLYEACPFEAVEVLGPQSDVNEGVKFDDSALSGPSVAPPALLPFRGVLDMGSPSYWDMRDDFPDQWISRGSLDAPVWLPSGSHRPFKSSLGHVCSDGFGLHRLN